MPYWLKKKKKLQKN